MIERTHGKNRAAARRGNNAEGSKIQMKPIEELTREEAGRIRYILTDIDDTLTNKGRLPAEAYSALWRLHDAGFSVIPVTGRSCGWCDLIAREWPVKAVVGENGAVVYYLDENDHLQVFTHPSVASPDVHEKLQAVREACLAAVPDSRVAKDQFSRVYDLAIDFAEEPPVLPLSDAERIREVCESMGAHAKVSSIHVNAWFGDYDKLAMTELFLREVLGEDDPLGRVMFFGDSPNDEPMFAHFPVTCGVANVVPFADHMNHLPAYVAPLEGGYGFAAAIDVFLRLRGL